MPFRPRPLAWAALPLAGLALLLVLSACGDDGPAKPSAELTTVTLVYESGSIAPPYNHNWTMIAQLSGASRTIDYRLTYRYRTAATVLPPNADTDLAYNAPIGDLAARFAALAAETTFVKESKDEPRRVGADTFNVAFNSSGGSIRSGKPVNRDAWLKLAAEVDALARKAGGRTAPGPF